MLLMMGTRQHELTLAFHSVLVELNKNSHISLITNVKGKNNNKTREHSQVKLCYLFSPSEKING